MDRYLPPTGFGLGILHIEAVRFHLVYLQGTQFFDAAPRPHGKREQVGQLGITVVGRGLLQAYDVSGIEGLPFVFGRVLFASTFRVLQPFKRFPVFGDNFNRLQVTPVATI